MIEVRTVDTADNTDALAGTDLETVPGPGFLLIWGASTQADTEVTITGGPLRPTARATLLPMRANGVPNINEDPPKVIPVTGGEKIVINLNIVTAATVCFVVQYFGPEDLT